MRLLWTNWKPSSSITGCAVCAMPLGASDMSSSSSLDVSPASAFKNVPSRSTCTAATTSQYQMSRKPLLQETGHARQSLIHCNIKSNAHTVQGALAPVNAPVTAALLRQSMHLTRHSLLRHVIKVHGGGQSSYLLPLAGRGT